MSASYVGEPSRSAATLLQQYQDVRKATERLCAPLAIEDYILQAMADVSPTRWHIAHVSWFFETFLLKPHLPSYESPHPKYEFLFNSYYNAVGPQYYRPHRGLISRPTVAEVYDYRAHVDQGMISLLEVSDEPKLAALTPALALGLNHEQQHQELILSDIKYNLALNPLRPAYHQREVPRGASNPPIRWLEFEGGIHTIGHDGVGFAFDNEWPRHEALLHPFRMASRPVTNGEFMEFMEAGGYETPTLWLSDGWTTVTTEGWTAPLYWEKLDGAWWMQTMSGMQPVDEHAPVSHVSYYEAAAFAYWAGKRLPTEQEWEHASAAEPLQAPSWKLASITRFLLWATAVFSRCTGTYGSGHRAPTRHTRGSSPDPAPSASTTASSWSTRWSCGVAPAPHPSPTSGPPIATFSHPSPMAVHGVPPGRGRLNLIGRHG